MPTDNSELVLCYNKGCGDKFDPNKNERNSCTFHPGQPVFHDAYKGWSCCSKKCTDFTEFLNIKGCTTSFHSNVKPADPVKPVVDQSLLDEVIEYKSPQPIVRTQTERPSFEGPLVTLVPEISAPLRAQMEALALKPQTETVTVDNTETSLNTPCQHGGCSVTYQGDVTPQSCQYHPGVPVFHEGLKFWSCCKKRTTDFASFLEQKGCTLGDHVWTKEEGRVKPKCRHDWHQTATHVVLTVYTRGLDPSRSRVQLNPVRVKFELVVGDGEFLEDWELTGVVDVNKCELSMTPTKVELKLRKAEPGKWSDLYVKRATPEPSDTKKDTQQEPPETQIRDDEPVDLSDIY